jgi:hypothetical protein
MPIELTKISRFRPTACMASMIVRACCGISSARFAWTTSWLGIAARGARIEYIAFDDFLRTGSGFLSRLACRRKSLRATSVFSKKALVVLRASWPFAPRTILSLAFAAPSAALQHPLIASTVGAFPSWTSGIVQKTKAR